jgi:chorismate mutase-like protein
MDDIVEWRKRIDGIDEKLLKLFNERAQCAIEIGKLKVKQGIEIHDPSREKDIISRICAINSGPLSNDAVQRIFKCLINESKKLEEK